MKGVVHCTRIRVPVCTGLSVSLPDYVTQCYLISAVFSEQLDYM